MRRRQFRLVLEPAPEEVVRLTQLHRYAGDVAGRGRAPIGGVLDEYICLVRWNPKAADGLIFGYKDMDEQSGPVEANCPRSILELLTSSSHPYALDWRNRCYAMLRLKERKVADGDILRLPEPLRFTDGSEHREFRVSKRGSKIELRTPDGFGAYRISRLMERRFEIIRPARRIKTFFPIAQ